MMRDNETVFVDNLKDASRKREEKKRMKMEPRKRKKDSELAQYRTASLLYRTKQVTGIEIQTFVFQVIRSRLMKLFAEFCPSINQLR